MLTAHPTEAKRATALGCHRELYLLLVRCENQMWTPLERRLLRDEIKAVLERLWRAGEILIRKPDITAELRNVIHYLREVFPDALPVLDARLRAAWAETGFDPALLQDPGQLPRLAFGNWVGGDRDGHSLVTAEVTARTLQTLRANALEFLHGRLSTLAARLSLAALLQEPPATLLERVAAVAAQLGKRGQKALLRNPQEPWRQFASLIVARLPDYASPNELMEDLRFLRASLREIGAARLAEADVEPVMRLVQTFGFHLAALDLRQNSRVHELALEQLLTAAGVAEGKFLRLGRGRRAGSFSSGSWRLRDRLRSRMPRSARKPRRCATA